MCLPIFIDGGNVVLRRYEKIQTCKWIKYDYRTICPKEHADADDPYWRIPENMSKGSSKSEIEKQLKSAGFVNITLTPKADKDKIMHEKIQSILLVGKQLKLDTKQEIVVKKNVPITVTYSDFSSFAELPNAISTTTVSDTKKLFTDGGFSQVSEQATETNDISKNGQMIAVEIDGKDFNSINDKVITKTVR